MKSLAWAWLFFGLVFLGTLAVTACGDGGPKNANEQNAETAPHGEEQGDHATEKAIKLSPEVMREFGIELETAGPGIIEKVVSLPGEVRPNQDRLAHIAPRFAGIAREVRARIGDAVKAGQVLAIIESESLSPYPLKTLIDGLVIEKHLTLGEPVSSEQAAFVVADLRDLWVDISVYQKDLPFVRVGSAAEISAGPGLQKTRGKISYVSPIVNEATRTAIARVVLPNPEGTWLPGLFVTARVIAERMEVPVAVPETAIEHIEGKPVVFVQESDGFVAREVELRRRGQGSVEVASGLSAGERYAARGGFTIKAEMSRESFSGDHGH
ncbi:MAG: efflux RND transporter periplasmic adaptor subunit [Deltaproteobacteria bacterium]|nr:efflux RND transporter periplasmic adaptor subunit [Deltaproteobacteria bacterium]